MLFPPFGLLLSCSGSVVPERKTLGTQTEGVVTVVNLGSQPLQQARSKSLVLTQPSLPTLPDSKNASTSTREISFPHASSAAPVSTSNAVTSTPVASSLQPLAATSTALPATATIASPTSSVAVTLPHSMISARISTPSSSAAVLNRYF